eukprot:maker-scaffold_12-snap-gene-8.16-mRNA-1 protein AED:0.02 eAED:0.02 QI:140/1/1/1/0/0/4/121/185
MSDTYTTAMDLEGLENKEEVEQLVKQQLSLLKKNEDYEELLAPRTKPSELLLKEEERLKKESNCSFLTPLLRNEEISRKKLLKSLKNENAEGLEHIVFLQHRKIEELEENLKYLPSSLKVKLSNLIKKIETFKGSLKKVEDEKYHLQNQYNYQDDLREERIKSLKRKYYSTVDKIEQLQKQFKTQ